MKRTAGLRCTICNHPARPQIDLAIATGFSKRAVAERFQVSRDAVWRHAQAHLTAEMRAALATKLLQREGDTRRILLEEGAGVTEALKAIRGPLFGLFLVAIDTGDNDRASPRTECETVLTPIRSLKIGSLRNERSASDRTQ